MGDVCSEEREMKTTGDKPIIFFFFFKEQGVSGVGGTGESIGGVAVGFSEPRYT